MTKKAIIKAVERIARAASDGETGEVFCQCIALSKKLGVKKQPYWCEDEETWKNN